MRWRVLRGFDLATIFGGAAIAGAIGCSNELSPREAERMLSEHFVEITPMLHHPDTLRAYGISERVIVSEILESGSSDREARWRWVSSGQDSLKRAVFDTTDIMTAMFRRSNQGWAIASYGPAMTELVIRQVEHDRFRAYYHIFVAANVLESAILHWRLAGDGRFTNEHAPPDSASLVPFIDKKEAELLRGHTWGLTRARSSIYSPVMWVKPAIESSAVCAIRLGDRMASDEKDLGWAGKDLSCRGVGDPYYDSGATDSIAAQIRKNGGVYKFAGK
jgi:hypothetical protein